MTEKERTFQDQMKDTVIDVRNEAIMQSASLYLLARKVLLAGLGAMALSVEEAQAFVDKLVERGEIAEADAQKLIQDFRERAEQQGEKLNQASEKKARQAEDVVEERIRKALDKMDVPTKRDVDQLSAQISELNQKIDALRQQRGA